MLTCALNSRMQCIEVRVTRSTSANLDARQYQVTDMTPQCYSCSFMLDNIVQIPTDIFPHKEHLAMEYKKSLRPVASYRSSANIHLRCSRVSCLISSQVSGQCMPRAKAVSRLVARDQFPGSHFCSDLLDPGMHVTSYACSHIVKGKPAVMPFWLACQFG